MKTKKIILTLVVVFTMILVLVLSGCTKTTEESQAPKEEETKEKITKDEEPIKDEEPVNITWMQWVDLATNQSWTTENVPLLLKERGYNVTFEVIEMGSHDPADWNTKFHQYLASGGEPADINQLAELRLGAVDSGWFIPLEMSLLETTIPEYIKQVDRIYKNMWAYGIDPRDGTLYGITSFNMFGPNRASFFYRTDWLETLGMSAPTNLEEFEAWLVAVRANDLNNNGKNDEYGMTSMDQTWSVGFMEIFGAYGIMPLQRQIRDGKAVYCEILPEAKEALALLRDWKERDLLPEGAMTTVNSYDDFNNGISGTLGQARGYNPAMVEGGAYSTNFYASQPNGTFDAFSPPKGPNGDYGAWEWGPRKYTTCFGIQLKDDPDKLEMILTMLETIALDVELFEAAMLGEEGTHWEWNEAHTSTRFIDPYTDFNKRLTEVGVREMSESAFCPIWIDTVFTDYLYPDAVKWSALQDGFYDQLLSIQVEAETLYKSDLDALTKSTYYDIIFGIKPLDAFDEYVVTWLENGGQEMMDDAQILADSAFN